jgi:hypothetical protein
VRPRAEIAGRYSTEQTADAYERLFSQLGVHDAIVPRG